MGFRIGDPCKPSFAAVTGKGPPARYIHILHMTHAKAYHLDKYIGFILGRSPCGLFVVNSESHVGHTKKDHGAPARFVRGVEYFGKCWSVATLCGGA